MRVTAALAVLAVLLVAGCDRGPAAIATATPTIPITDLRSAAPPGTVTPSASPTEQAQPTTPPTPPSATATPAPTATPIDLSPTDSPPPSAGTGGPSAGCVNGWIRPAAGSVEYEHALDVLSAQMGVDGPWLVEDMRYFTGPDLPFVEPQHESVERWYVKAALVDDPTFRARWLIERRTDAIQGISAVAQYASVGYAPNVWTAFVGEGEPVSYLGLPGQWSGIPYDFVTGEGDSGNPGLPDEVADCLSDT